MIDKGKMIKLLLPLCACENNSFYMQVHKHNNKKTDSRLTNYTSHQYVIDKLSKILGQGVT